MTAKQAGLLAYRSSECLRLPDITGGIGRPSSPDYSGATASFTDDKSFELPYSPFPAGKGTCLVAYSVLSTVSLLLAAAFSYRDFGLGKMLKHLVKKMLFSPFCRLYHQNDKPDSSQFCSAVGLNCQPAVNTAGTACAAKHTMVFFGQHYLYERTAV